MGLCESVCMLVNLLPSEFIAEMLMKLGGKCPRIIRVYSEKVERQIYSLPNDPVPPKKSGVEREPLPHLKVGNHVMD